VRGGQCRAVRGLGRRVRVVRSHVFRALGTRRYDMILSNPPYVPTREIAALPAEYRCEPRLGLEAGADGLRIVRAILNGAARHLRPGGILVVEVGDTAQEIEPGTLVFFPTGVPHRLRAHGGPLDYFEIQAWRSFKTSILSEETQGLKWFYEAEKPGAPRVEWNQS